MYINDKMKGIGHQVVARSRTSMKGASTNHILNDASAVDMKKSPFVYERGQASAVDRKKLRW